MSEVAARETGEYCGMDVSRTVKECAREAKEGYFLVTPTECKL